MKKKRAILLFGFITLITLGYLAWCGRAFYLSAPAPDLSEVPAQYRADAFAMIKKHGLTAPEAFDRKLFIGFLAKPYASAPRGMRSMDVTPGPGSGFHLILIVTRGRWHSHGPQADVVITGRRMQWNIEATRGSHIIEKRNLRELSP
jgi:hypothetical protein